MTHQEFINNINVNSTNFVESQGDINENLLDYKGLMLHVYQNLNDDAKALLNIMMVEILTNNLMGK